MTPNFGFPSTTSTSGGGGASCQFCYGTVCNGTCVDTSGDHENCGACGNACNAYQHCNNGACECYLPGTCTTQCACGAGSSACGADCVLLDSDPNHCGNCNTSCDGGACVSGACVFTDSDAGVGVFFDDQIVGPAPIIEALAVADLNADGHPDLVVAEGSDAFTHDGGVLFFPGFGDGGFGPSVRTRALGVDDVAVADFDRDGHLDVAVADAFSTQLTILFGVGDGTFLREAAVPVPTPTLVLETGDFNGDGLTDLLVGSYTDVVSVVLLGHGDGGFGAPLPGPGDLLLSLGEPRAYALGDFNEDGTTDVAFDHIAFAQHDGSFVQGPQLYPGTTAAAGDLDGDGHLDLVMFTNQDTTASCALYAALIFHGNGDGTFTFGDAIPLTQPPNLAAIGDFDGDGKPDLAIDYFEGAVQVFSGDGAGHFTARPQVYTVGYLATELRVADVNGDGRADVLMPALEEGDVELLLAR